MMIANILYVDAPQGLWTASFDRVLKCRVKVATTSNIAAMSDHYFCYELKK